MGIPETGTDVSTGGWVTVQPGLPEMFKDITDTIQSLLQALISVLNVILAVLQVVKAFVSGLLDPLVAIIEDIITEIEGLLNDIRQIGLYISGDMSLMDDAPKFSKIRGGFVAYERRMVGRLVDRSDPTRPDFSSRSAVIAIFLYASADTSAIGALLQTIQKIMAFFGKGVPIGASTVPVSLRVSYGADFAVPSAFGPLMQTLRGGDLPDKANLQWQMSPSGSSVQWPSLAPKGFLIEISTVPQGLLLAYDTITKNTTTGPNAKTRSYGLMRDPATKLPFRLYGGADVIDVGDLEGGVYKEDADGTDRTTKLYAYRNSADNIPIPIESLKQGTGSSAKYLLQRTFFVKAGFLDTASPGQGYAAMLSREDMPWHAEFTLNESTGVVTAEAVGDQPAETVYVRVSGVTTEIVDAVVTTNGTGKTGAVQASLDIWNTSSSWIVGGYTILGTQFGVPAKTAPSQPATITFPSGSTLTYLDTVTVALAIMVLSRSDLSVGKVAEGFQSGKAATATGLEEISRFLFPMLIGRRDRYFKRRGVSPEDFRQQLLRKCRRAANYMYLKSGPNPDLEKQVNNLGEPLRTFKWREEDSAWPDQTIMETLQYTGIDTGVALNPLALGYNVKFMKHYYDNRSITRSPGFMEKGTPSPWIPEKGSADFSPVVYGADIGWGRRVAFCRNVLPDEIYESTAKVLNLSGAVLTLETPDEGAWDTYRMFPQGLPSVEAALDEILKWVKSIRAGIQGFTDIIIAYIEFLQARILEMQALIVRIDGLLDSLSAVVLPAVSGLVVTGNGTAGILSALVTAENKPSDISQTLTVDERTYGTYGAGVVILAGGLPAILVEILQVFFPEAD